MALDLFQKKIDIVNTQIKIFNDNNIKIPSELYLTYNVPQELKQYLKYINIINSVIKNINKYVKLKSYYSYEKLERKIKNRIKSKHILLKKIYDCIINIYIDQNILKEIYNLQPSIKYRDNQLDAINRLVKNGLETGIHCQATGCGKSYIFLYYIDYVIKKIKSCKIILFTERKNIFIDLFGLNNIDNHNRIINEWKEKGICDLTNINIIEKVINKKKDFNFMNDNNNVLLIINRAFLDSCKDFYKKFNKVDLILHDECHSTSSKSCKQFLNHFKNTKMVGFSATPVRTGKQQLKDIINIYGDGTNLTLLTNYSLLKSIENKYILPPVFNWYTFDNYYNDKKNEISDNEINAVLNCLNEKIDILPNKKLIAWCNYIHNTENWYKSFLSNYKKFDKLKTFKFFIDFSKNSDEDYETFKNIKENAILFCAQKHREGSDIKYLDGCLFLDKVKNRDAIPFIQSIGRVLRLSTGKEYGYIFDGIKTNDYKSMIDKIIYYYQTLQNLTKVEELSNIDNNKRIDRINDNLKIENDNVIMKFENIKLKINTIKFKICEKKLQREIKKRKKSTNCRDPSLCFYNGDKIRHVIKNNIWEFTYNLSEKSFLYENEYYNTMNQITEKHYRNCRPDRTSNNNAWFECQVYRNHQWMSTMDLPIIKDI